MKSEIPTREEPWPRDQGLIQKPAGELGGNYPLNNTAKNDEQDDSARAEIIDYVESKDWTWSGNNLLFFCDIHADADAFFRSLIASGGVKHSGDEKSPIELTAAGRASRFLIGGDCFDKGPSNFALLDLLKQLIDTGAEIELLAGNHDIRTYLGYRFAESKDPLLDHLFVRMGRKTIPLLKEIYDNFIANEPADDTSSAAHLDEALIREILYPSETWYKNFPIAGKSKLSGARLEKELRRVRQKTVDFNNHLKIIGLNLSQVFAAVRKFRALFLEPSGEYFWFFDRMKLAHREGAYLFVHAGIDDTCANLLDQSGVGELNRRFKEMLRKDPFSLYHGELGNMIRTKYRPVDYHFSEQGAEALNHAAVFAIVHGHRNLLKGQRMCIREGVLNFECDASVNCNTRLKEGLDGPGTAVVSFESDGVVKGISSDYACVKKFVPPNVTILDQEEEGAFDADR